jgi:hypothetical protein
VSISKPPIEGENEGPTRLGDREDRRGPGEGLEEIREARGRFEGDCSVHGGNIDHPCPEVKKYFSTIFRVQIRGLLLLPVPVLAATPAPRAAPMGPTGLVVLPGPVIGLALLLAVFDGFLEAHNFTGR